MSGIYQKQVNSGSVAAPSANRTLISVNESGELFTKDSSGNVIVYPTSSNGGGGSPFPFTGSADISGTLNIDFTDTISYITEEDYGIDRGKFFLPGVGWLPLQFQADTMGSVVEDDDVLFQKLSFTGEFDTGMGIVPVYLSGDTLNVKSGDYSGSFLSNGLLKDPTGTIENQSHLSVQKGADNRGYTISTAIVNSTDQDGIYIQKTNESGERIAIVGDNTNTGFVIGNELSDNGSSILRIANNNVEAILEFFNDYLVSETIPALDYADDAAAEAGGVPPGGIYHNSGSIRIRLT